MYTCVYMYKSVLCIYLMCVHICVHVYVCIYVYAYVCKWLLCSLFTMCAYVHMCDFMFASPHVSDVCKHQSSCKHMCLLSAHTCPLPRRTTQCFCGGELWSLPALTKQRLQASPEPSEVDDSFPVWKTSHSVRWLLMPLSEKLMSWKCHDTLQSWRMQPNDWSFLWEQPWAMNPAMFYTPSSP